MAVRLAAARQKRTRRMGEQFKLTGSGARPKVDPDLSTFDTLELNSNLRIPRIRSSARHEFRLASQKRCACVCIGRIAEDRLH
ncbi:unnamed protein product [Protopolystoma xenopodis]|uniref:Uncharacterized protein n=1 Tax=Protopolystoma xenopodis TaxID=117903 RepID=A0A448WLJ4_9PLAT|nr:unnamed protein product [Protopolystoma xenopodis]